MIKTDFTVLDSFTGAIAAVEGILDAAVLLNSPTGCKFFHGALSDAQMPRVHSLDPLYYAEDFYFGQPRVPATFLDDYDYVFGATEKLKKILPVVAAKGHRLIAVVNSPGAALIGDDLNRFIRHAGLGVPCIAIENTGFSKSLAEGFQQAVMEVLTTLSPGMDQSREKSVNLLGLSISHHHWQGNLRALTALLKACGIRVNTCICAGCSLSDLETLTAAHLNLVVHDEYADQLARFLKEKFGMESLAVPTGAPIGFTASESWIQTVCSRLDTDPAPGLDLVKKARTRAYQALNRFNALTGLPKGAAVAVEADASIALPLVTWLYQYLGMVPVSVHAPNGLAATRARLKAFLASIHCNDAWQSTSGPPDLAFGSGGFIARLKLAHPHVAGIELALPSAGYQHVIPKTYMGPEGSLYLIEQIINKLAHV